MRQNNKTYLSQRLVSKMEKCFDGGMTIVRAPAGFGKSVSTQEYFRRHLSAMSQVFWLDCQDKQPDELCNEFFDAVAQVDSASAEKLRTQGTLNSSNAYYSAEIIKSIKSRLPVWFVADRFECMPESFLSYCAEFSSPLDDNVHFVIITREAPEIDAPYITEADLTLDKGEIKEFFSNNNIKLHQKNIDAVSRTTAGWLTAVSLILECIEITGELPSISDVDSMIEAIYDDLPGQRRKELRRVSNFKTISSAQMNFLLEEREMPDETRQFFSEFPLIRFDKKKGLWYIHEFLSDYMTSNSNDVVALSRSAAWYVQIGKPVKAIECFYSRLDYEGVLSVDISGIDPYEQVCGVPFVQIARELARCPAELKLEYPLNMLRVAFILFGDGDYSAYESLMSEMETIINETGDTRNYGEWLLASVWSLFPNLDSMIERVKFAAQQINGQSRLISPHSRFAFGSISMLHLFHSVSGSIDTEIEKFKDFIIEYSEVTGGNGLGADKLFIGEAYCEKGQLGKAEIAAFEAETIARTTEQLTIAVGALFLQGRIAVNRLDADAAEAAVKKLDRLLLEFPRAGGYSSKRQINAAKGILNVLMKKSVAKDRENSIYGSGAISMLLRLANSGNLMTDKNYREAAGYMEALLAMDSRSCTPMYKQYLYMGLSICYEQTEDIQNALRCIQSALDLAESDGFLMTLAHSGTELDRMLTLAEPANTDAIARIADIRSQTMSDYEEELKFAAKVSLDERFRNLPEPLTDREIEIAKLAAEGKRNKEIAALLFLSERTVSNRLYTIFQKLNIDRRSELMDFIK